MNKSARKLTLVLSILITYLCTYFTHEMGRQTDHFINKIVHMTVVPTVGSSLVRTT